MTKCKCENCQCECDGKCEECECQKERAQDATYEKTTVPEELSTVRNIAPELPLLIPGIGAQGGDLEHSIRVGNSTGIGIINVSRSISFAGNLSKSDIKKSAVAYVSRMNEALNE